MDNIHYLSVPVSLSPSFTLVAATMNVDFTTLAKATSVPGSIQCIMIDNYDSFTWNIVQFLSGLGATVTVFRNDKITIPELKALKPTHLVLSPGPGNPGDSGICAEAIAAFQGEIPILGVCLGEQTMFHMYGGTVGKAGEYVHGKTSPVYHDGKGLYKGVPSPVKVMRFHSLVGVRDTLPSAFVLTSETENGLVMGIRHKTYVMEGVQFHPESILTEHGMDMIRNFLQWKCGTWKAEQERRSKQETQQ